MLLSQYSFKNQSISWVSQAPEQAWSSFCFRLNGPRFNDLIRWGGWASEWKIEPITNELWQRSESMVCGGIFTHRQMVPHGSSDCLIASFYNLISDLVSGRRGIFAKRPLFQTICHWRLSGRFLKQMRFKGQFCESKRAGAGRLGFGGWGGGLLVVFKLLKDIIIKL